jgi:flavin reductase (DIM6/NTAB) family NADH-FMN oxidoreductase RutF
VEYNHIRRNSELGDPDSVGTAPGGRGRQNGFRTYQTVKTAQTFALNMLGKEQKSLAFTFFRPADVSDGKLSGQSFRKGTTGSPILVDAPGAVECHVVSIVEHGDHHIVVGEVVDAHLNKPPASG